MSEQRHEWLVLTELCGPLADAKVWRDSRRIVRANKWAELRWKEEILRLSAALATAQARIVDLEAVHLADETDVRILERKLAASEEARAKAEEVVRAFLAKYDLVEPAIIGAFAFRANHVGQYSGPHFGEELAALRASVVKEGGNDGKS